MTVYDTNDMVEIFGIRFVVCMMNPNKKKRRQLICKPYYKGGGPNNFSLWHESQVTMLKQYVELLDELKTLRKKLANSHKIKTI